MDFTALFYLQRIDNQDLAIIKKSIFCEFLKFLPETELIRFKEYLRLICPYDVSDAAFVGWVSYVLTVVKTKQNDLCDRVGISTTKLSKFLNGGGELGLAERLRVKSELQRDLISEGFVKP